MSNVNDDEVVEIEGEGKNGAPWPEKNLSIFIGLMEEEVKKNNRPTTTFTKNSWAYIKGEMKKKTGFEYTHDQLKNKFNQLRAVYRDFQKLMSSTGAGWDPVLMNVVLSPKVWESNIKVIKHARTFKKKGCPYFPQLCIIYGDTTATGENAYPPTKLPSDSEKEEPIDDNRYNDHATSISTKTRSRSTTTKRARHSKDNVNTTVALAMAAFAEDSKRRTNLLERKTDLLERKFASAQPHVDSPTGSGATSGHSSDLVQECLDVLNAMEDIAGVTYSKVLNKLHDDHLWRRIFLGIPAQRRKEWILTL